ncbi:MAG TPA: rhomboid family intramembrane serine protease [Phaeodactylibacter sp.]|nr:rhomboid family intramembrane serine protease [Phaeodactylibacter sp.]
MITLTLIIVIFTCLISYQAMNDRAMKSKLLMHPASVHEFGQWYRLLTSGFVHNDWMHLGVNMYVLWMFGESLERFFLHYFGDLQGRIFYILLYLGAIIFSSLPAYLKHKDNQYYSSLGASGGVSAITFALILFAPWAGLRFIFFPFVDIPFVVFGFLYLIYESYMSKKGNDMIGHDAHIAGAIFGITGTLLLAFLVKPELVNIFIFNITNPALFLTQ